MVHHHTSDRMKQCLVFHHIAILFLVVIFSLSGSACKKDNPVDPAPASEPTEFRHAFYPMAVGNTWIYDDTTMTFAGPVYSTDTTKIISWRRDSLGVWWMFRAVRLGTTRTYELMERNDSVFTLQYGFTVEHLGFAAIDYLYPGSADTIFFQTFVGGDAAITKAAVIDLASFKTPSGNFKGVVHYSSGQTNLEEHIAKGVGIVGTDEFYITSFAPGPVGATTRLKSYTLVR